MSSIKGTVGPHSPPPPPFQKKTPSPSPTIHNPKVYILHPTLKKSKPTPTAPAPTRPDIPNLDPLQKPLLQQFENIPRRAHVELGSEPRLSEPGRDGPAFDGEGFEDGVDVVVVRVVVGADGGVEVAGGEGALRVGRVGGGDVGSWCVLLFFVIVFVIVFFLICKRLGWMSGRPGNAKPKQLSAASNTLEKEKKKSIKNHDNTAQWVFCTSH